MKAQLDCLPCIVRQAVDAARHSTEDAGLRRAAVKAALEALAQAPLDATPMRTGFVVHRAVARVTGVDDPWIAAKTESNRHAMELLPTLRQLVADADDHLLTAARIAIAGNIMDFGVFATFDVEDSLQRALDGDFAVEDFDAFRVRVKTARRVLYIADNAGEIVFDRVLLEQMSGAEITLAVKSAPFINDAMLADAEQVGLGAVAHLIGIPPGATGAPQFDRAWAQADIIIAKGQGNYEVFSDADGPLFFLLLAKCPVVAANIGVRQGDMVFEAQATHRILTH